MTGKTPEKAHKIETPVPTRTTRDRIWKLVIIFIALVSTIPLFLILVYLVKNGIAAVNFNFLVSLPQPPGEPGGGISNAIVGTFIIIALSSLFSIPIGIFTGIYLYEYPHTRLAYLVRLCVDILQGLPSIVIGIIIWLVMVVPMKHFSALSGGVALSIMMLPVIVRSTEETLNLTPFTLKEASLALGVPYYRTIMRVVVRSGMSGILTGVLLGIARIAGETAPLLFTAFGSPYMNINITKPMNTLPLLIFNYAASPYQQWHTIAWGASFVLIIFILILNIISRVVIKK
ncbi:MAG: phosphate ABC transporter permease PstA [Spirochaetota bacterium]